MGKTETLSVRREPVRDSKGRAIGRAGLGAATLVLAATLAVPALAADDSFEITIKNHRFEPDAVTVPAGKQVKLVVTNMDGTPEEFESHELDREKVVVGGGKAVILIGPLEPGTYPFFGEFHQDTAQGKIIAE